jgi:perosamine synthetase
MIAGAQRPEAERVIVLVRDLKQSGGAAAGFPRPIRWAGGVIGEIRVLNGADVTNDDLLNRLCTWRNRHRTSFFTQFEATLESTRNWLVNLVLDDPQRALFLVSDEAGRLVGHCGARHIHPDGAEIDSIMRGERLGHGLLMKLAVRAVIDWLFKDLRVHRTYARVFADNSRSMRLFLSLGMTVTRWESFRRVTQAGIVRYEPTGELNFSNGLKVAHMELLSEDFRNFVPE